MSVHIDLQEREPPHYMVRKNKSPYCYQDVLDLTIDNMMSEKTEDIKFIHVAIHALQ